MVDDEIAAEALVRKKPRKIIHDQLIIQLLLGFAPVIAGIITLIPFAFITVFPYTFAVIFAVWLVSATVYAAVLILRRRYRKLK